MCLFYIILCMIISYIYYIFRWNHSSNTTCLKHDFSVSGEYCSKLQ